MLSTFLSRVNLEAFSRLVRSQPLLQFPYKAIAQRLIDWRFPPHIFLEATNLCNLHCDICSRTAVPQPGACMDFALFKKVVDEARQYGPRSFCLHIFGEPLLAPRIIDMIRYLKTADRRNTILLTTNGIMLKEDSARAVVDCGVDRLVVSLIAATPQTYQRITGKDALQIAEDNVKNLLVAKKASGKATPRIYVRMIEDERTQPEAAAFRKKWAPYAVTIDLRPRHNYAGKISEVAGVERRSLRRYPCYHLWFSPAVNCQGDLSICCCDWEKEAVLGTITTSSVRELWAGSLLRQLREYHLRGEYEKIPLCAGCNVWATYPDIFFAWQKK